MTVWTWVIGAACLVGGAVGGFFLGVWFLRRSMANMQWDDQDIAQMARRMGMNLNPRQLQAVKQQMKKAGSQQQPLFGRKGRKDKKAGPAPARPNSSKKRGS